MKTTEKYRITLYPTVATAMPRATSRYLFGGPIAGLVLCATLTLSGCAKLWEEERVEIIRCPQIDLDAVGGDWNDTTTIIDDHNALSVRSAVTEYPEPHGIDPKFHAGTSSDYFAQHPQARQHSQAHISQYQAQSHHQTKPHLSTGSRSQASLRSNAHPHLQPPMPPVFIPKPANCRMRLQLTPPQSPPLSLGSIPYDPPTGCDMRPFVDLSASAP